jgi:hypothetical protein
MGDVGSSIPFLDNFGILKIKNKNDKNIIIFNH